MRDDELRKLITNNPRIGEDGFDEVESSLAEIGEIVKMLKKGPKVDFASAMESPIVENSNIQTAKVSNRR